MEEQNKKRLYKVVLRERTTNPRVNLYIRELTDATVWQASTMMNAVPSTIVDGIPLHKAIEVKSRLNRFGLNSTIESSELESEAAPSGIEAADTEVAKERVSVEQKSEVTPIIPPVKLPKPQPPSRLKHGRKKKRPLYYLLSLFLMLIIIVIVWLLAPPEYRLKPKSEPEIITGSDVDKLPKRLKITRPPSETVGAEQLKAEKPSTPPAEFDKPEEPSQLLSQAQRDQPDSGQDLVWDREPRETGESPKLTPSKTAGRGELPVSGLTPDQSMERIPGEQGDFPPGLDIPAVVETPAPVGSAHYISGDTSPGISQSKLEDLLRGAQRVVNDGDSPSAGINLQRLELAEALVKPEQRQIRAILEEDRVERLRLNLKNMADLAALEEGVEFIPEIVGAKIRIYSNLPEGTILGIDVSEPGGEKPGNYALSLQDNMIQIPSPIGLPSGIFTVRVFLYPYRVQPVGVLETIGLEGERLSGHLLSDKGELDYTFNLNNMMARSRGEISEEEAEEEFARLMDREGKDDFALDDFNPLEEEKSAFVTISADNVDESEFIASACRSIGLLTKEMDNPPKYLRIIANGYQYFIPTHICRRALREFRQDDPGINIFIFNHLIPF